MTTAENIQSAMLALKDEEQARHLMRFFKCGKGDYGEGDRFLGLRNPQTREIVKRFRDEAELSDCLTLVESPYHEIRFAGFLLMIEIFNRYRRKKDEEGMRTATACYIESIPRGNNWDLVDVIAPHILGEWLLRHPEEAGILQEFADRADSLWHQRVGIVTNWMLIRRGHYEEIFPIAEKMLTHTHDLIHKATGWMLREGGKRDLDRLLHFLDRHAPRMPRTMLRYTIEKLPSPLRHHYLTLPRSPKNKN